MVKNIFTEQKMPNRNSVKTPRASSLRIPRTSLSVFRNRARNLANKLKRQQWKQFMPLDIGNDRDSLAAAFDHNPGNWGQVIETHLHQLDHAEVPTMAAAIVYRPCVFSNKQGQKGYVFRFTFTKTEMWSGKLLLLVAISMFSDTLTRESLATCADLLFRRYMYDEPEYEHLIGEATVIHTVTPMRPLQELITYPRYDPNAIYEREAVRM